MSKHHRPFTLRPLLLAMALSGAIGSVWATAPTIGATVLPTDVTGKQGMTLQAGTSVLSTSTSQTGIVTMTATQTSTKAVWEAQDFSIGAKAAFVNNATLGANTDTLIRVMGSNPSVLAGSVTANNRLWLVNRNGLYVGSGASINVGSLLMSARDLSDASAANNYQVFMDGKQPVQFALGADGNDFTGGFIEIDPGATVNASGGAVLVASKYIYNRGTVQAGDGGEVSMLVANDAEVQIGDSGFITLAPLTKTATDNPLLTGRALLNEGKIQADNGKVQLIVAGSGNDGVTLNQPVFTASASATATTINGVANTGQIIAHTKDGKSSSITLAVIGTNNGVVINSGTIDVSSADALSKGGDITVAGPEVTFMDSSTDSPAQLLADGALGGGQITVVGNGTANTNGDRNFISVSGNHVMSADATVKGDGGSIRILGAANVDIDPATRTTDPKAPPPQGTYTGTTLVSANSQAPSDVVLQGTFNARGGEQGGNGGSFVVSGSYVQTRVQTNVDVAPTAPTINVTARNASGSHGWVRYFSPEILVGSAAALANSDTSASLLQDTDINTWLHSGANVQIATYADANHLASFNAPYVEMLSGTRISSTYSGAQQLQVDSAGDIYLGRVGTGADIQIASRGPMGVSLSTDTDNVGRGSLFLVGAQQQVLASVPGRVNAQATSTGAVLIETNGGDIRIKGRTQQETTLITTGTPVVMDNVLLDAGTGKVSVVASGASVPSEGTLHYDGISINNSEIYGSDISVVGRSQGATGVTLTATTLDTSASATGGIEVRGASEGNATGGTHTGVNAQGLTVYVGGSGRFEMTGRAVGGANKDAVGVQASFVDVSTGSPVASGAVPRITVVGESGDSTAPGLYVHGITLSNVSGTSQSGYGIRVYGNDGTGSVSNADVVLGAKAGPTASTAMTLTGSNFNTTGRINVRPLSVDGSNLGIKEDPFTQVYIGALPDVVNFPTNFLVDPGLVNGDMGRGLNIVVGSSGQVGSITVADHVFNGANVVTLQNQGEGSGGISLGTQDGVIPLPVVVSPVPVQAAAADAPATAGTFNLVTTGDVTQTGPLVAQSVTVVAGPQSTVSLNNTGNQIDKLLITGGRTVTTAGAVTPSASGTVTAFDAANDRFVTISATTNPDGPATPVGPSPEQIVAPSRVSVESTETLAELRTDVYVRGQFTRPQVCTPANTGGNAAVDLDADPLSQQWLQVRRSAQLSSCSGVRSDSNCSAF